MNEEYVSGSLYRAAMADPAIEVLSWQSVDGKGYFAADIKLRLPDDRRVEPDLIIVVDGRLWLIEVKARHSEALADETKLAELLGLLGKDEILRQVRVRSGVDIPDMELVLAVAYYGDDVDSSAEGVSDLPEPGPTCVEGVVHVDWEALEPEVSAIGLSATLAAVYSAQQSST